MKSPYCYSNQHSFFSTDPLIPDGRVVCLSCGASTRPVKSTDQRYTKAANLYRDIKKARDNWNQGKVLRYKPVKAQHTANIQSDPNEIDKWLFG